MVVVVVAAYNCVASYVDVSYTREIGISVHNSCTVIPCNCTVLVLAANWPERVNMTTQVLLRLALALSESIHLCHQWLSFILHVWPSCPKIHALFPPRVLVFHLHRLPRRVTGA